VNEDSLSPTGTNAMFVFMMVVWRVSKGNISGRIVD
jgi:hypothetical protein